MSIGWLGKQRWGASVRLAVLGLGAGIALAGCRESRAQGELAAIPECESDGSLRTAERPNIVLVVLGSARYSHLGAGGYPRATTPFLDSLRERGIWFPNAHAAASSPLPALASLLTGLPPGAHGLETPGSAAAAAERSLPAALPSLVACLHQAGYRTLARSSEPALGAAALARSFDDFAVDPELSAAGSLDELSRWLAREAHSGRDPESGAPFFALLVLADARLPYLPRYEYYRAFERRGDAGIARAAYPAQAQAAMASARARLQRGEALPKELVDLVTDLYDAELRQLDDALARLPQLLQQAGVARRSLIAVTADHGERLLEKDDLGHGGPLDFRTLHVPLVLAGPGLPRGRRDPQLARSIDLFPTLTARVGLRPRAGIPGRDLLAPGADAGDSPSGPRKAGGAREGAAPDSAYARSGREEMVRSGRFAYYRRDAGGAELYDLERDPQERHDLAARHPTHVRWLEGELAHWRALELRQGGGALPLAATPQAAR